MFSLTMILKFLHIADLENMEAICHEKNAECKHILLFKNLT